ncbi:MAG: hypothetical protein RL026_111 [Pseudomonadota bacterium]|jgi:hypothetical protein
MARPLFRSPVTSWRVLLAAASLLTGPVASAAINITVTRTSDTLATLSVDAGSALGANGTGEGFYLWGVFDLTCSDCGHYPQPTILAAPNLTSNTIVAGGSVSPNEVGSFFLRSGGVETFPGTLAFHWITSTTGALTGSATIDLSGGAFAGTGAYWRSVGSSGPVMGLPAEAPAGGWSIVAGSAAPVPEPETWALMLVGSSGLLWRLRRRLQAGGVSATPS